MSRAVRKAVIPVAGFGTRVLPATKVIPKEMLPVYDRPALQYVVDEALAAGIEHFIFITGRNKGAIEDYFDHAYELEDALTKKNKAAASEQPEAAKRARRGGKEPAAASDDTPRAGTTIESGGSSSRRSSVRPLRPRTSPSLIDPGVVSTQLTHHHSRASAKTRVGT